MTQIKICGFTDPKEAAFISYPDVSYMGMVLFFEKSKRNISIETAKAIMRAADPRIQKVAVVVSPTVEQAKDIEKAGFDFLQVHGVLRKDVLAETAIPIIRAYNGGAGEEAENFLRPLVENNIRRMLESSPEKALSGPVERNDVETVQKHLQILQGSDRTVYLALSEEVLSVAKKKNPQRDYRELERLLREDRRQ